ncbi:MAG: hypothetical protein ACRDV4_09050 [Acidimicrobiales bacterium]
MADLLELTRTGTRRRSAAIAACLVFASSAVIVTGWTRNAYAAGTLSAASFVQQWSAGPLSRDKGEPIAESSPTVADLSGGPAVVVGDRSGYVWAYHLSDGSEVSGWPAYDGGVPIDSTPSSAALGADGLDNVYVGIGNAQAPGNGGYEAFGPSGRALWYTRIAEPSQDVLSDYGVQASLTVSDLQGSTDVFAGSLDQESYALAGSTGAVLTGWPFFSADSVFSTAAAANLYGNGQEELVTGGASTAGFAVGQTYPQGGHLRVLNSRGGLVCHYDTNQEVDSSPAVGGFLAGGATGIAVGTGSFFSGASQTDTLLAFGARCNLVWSEKLNGLTTSSPALADVEGDGSLQVVEGTDSSSGGSVWVLNGTSGAPIWHTSVTGSVIGSAVAADLTGQGYDDVLVPTVNGVEVLDGRTGAPVTVLGAGLGFQNSPLVTDDPNGTIGITLAGYNASNEGMIVHYEIPGSNGALGTAAGSWPMFHHDPQLTGVAQPGPSSVSGCSVPAAANPGYDLVARDGGVFSFRQPFCGSTGGLRLAAPIVGMTMAPNTGGYWLAGSDGGIFCFGGAQYYGSVPGLGIHIGNIVGIAATPDGGGYWLVGSDGGVFSFGDAKFFGSMGGQHLNAPVVGMAATADGAGYRLVAADGGIFTFGDAQYFGSMGGRHLNAPVVGMATDLATAGYWLIAADGGVFSFGATFFGSTGNLRLAKPMVGMAATADGRGYWLVAADGGVFSFGDTSFSGSMGGVALNASVVGMEGFTQ